MTCYMTHRMKGEHENTTSGLVHVCKLAGCSWPTASLATRRSPWGCANEMTPELDWLYVVYGKVGLMDGFTVFSSTWFGGVEWNRLANFTVCSLMLFHRWIVLFSLALSPSFRLEIRPTLNSDQLPDEILIVLFTL